MVICQDCGKEVPKDKFCKNCGAYLGDIEEMPVIEEVPAIEETEASEVSEETSVPGPVESANVNFCHNCGSKITGNFKFCPNCGQDLNDKVLESPKTVASSEKNIILAIILSVILPGLGQIYLGLDRKGAIFLIAYVVSAILILFLIGFLLCTVIWIWALIDTIISTNSINKGEEVVDKLF